MLAVIVAVVGSMSLFSIFTRCNNFLCCFLKMRAVFVFMCGCVLSLVGRSPICGGSM